VDVALEVAEEEVGSSDAEQDTELSNSIISQVDTLENGDGAPFPEVLTNDNDRRGTFTFTASEDQHDFGDHEMAHPPDADGFVTTSEPQLEQDTTIARLFRSPVRKDEAPSLDRRQSLENVEYPELPESPEGEIDMQETEEEQPTNLQPDDTATNDTILEALTSSGEDSEEVDSEGEERPSGLEEVDAHKEDLVSISTPVKATEIMYPSLPTETSTEEAVELPSLAEPNTPEIESAFDALASRMEDGELDMEVDDEVDEDDEEESPDEEFTEASLQLDLQRELETELEGKQADAEPISEQDHNPAMEDKSKSEDLAMSGTEHDLSVDTEDRNAAKSPVGETENDDIAAGLTLGFLAPSSREPTPRKLRSPSPPPTEHGPDDATMTMALDDDTAILKDFLSRAAASKATKTTTTHRRESVQNRRDSDVVRHALASPRKVLEDKDPNSPSKYDTEATLDLSQTLTLLPGLQAPASPTQDQDDAEVDEDSKASRSRRSSRTRKSRLPAPSSLQPAGPPKIAVRRADGGEPIVLKKSDAQELSLLTRANTRRNKQGSFAVNVRLAKLLNDSAARSEGSTVDAVQIQGKKYVRWDEQLTYYQQGTDTAANMLADAESLATPDELSLPAPSSAKSKQKVAKDKNSTPKIRRVRGLGTANGTPGKGLLQPASLLPEAVQEEKDAAQAQAQPQRLPKPKSSSKLKKMPVASTASTSTSSITTPALAPSKESKLPTLDVAPVGVEPTQPSAATATATKERKSRLATPRRVKLPQPTSASVLVDGKENQQRTGIAAATPKKGIPMPSSGIVPPGGVVCGGETGLPRRRARRL
jgi:hypothetical protein